MLNSNYTFRHGSYKPTTTCLQLLLILHIMAYSAVSGLIHGTLTSDTLLNATEAYTVNYNHKDIVQKDVVQEEGVKTENTLILTTENTPDKDQGCNSISCLINLKNRTLDDRHNIHKHKLSSGTYVALGILFVLAAVLVGAAVTFVFTRCVNCSCRLTWSWGEQNTVEPSVELTQVTPRQSNRHNTVGHELGSRSMVPQPYALFQTARRSPEVASCPEIVTTSHC